MFIAGAGLAGAAALAKAGTASAVDDEPVLVGNPDNETDDGATVVTNTNNTATSPGTAGQEAILGVLTGADNGSHAVKGVTSGRGHSVAGDTPAGTNTVAATWGRHGGAGAGIGGVSADGYGGEFIGGKSHVRLIIPDGGLPAGPPAGDGHLVGELYADGAGGLWYNTADGDNFVQLTRQGGGTVLLNDPQRAYDSREEFPVPANTNKGVHTAEETRRIDLTEFTDLPAGAQGAVINVVAVGTVGQGFLTVFNGDTDPTSRPNAATLNWVVPGDNIANGVIVPTGVDGTVNVFTKQQTDVVIDVVGYIS